MPSSRLPAAEAARRSAVRKAIAHAGGALPVLRQEFHALKYRSAKTAS
jgi:hypothetical protein